MMFARLRASSPGPLAVLAPQAAAASQRNSWAGKATQVPRSLVHSALTAHSQVSKPLHSLAFPAFREVAVTSSVLAEPQVAAPAPSAGAGAGARVVISNLSKTYHHGGVYLPVLANLSLTLERGDMAAVVGASGVGKSTFLQILGTLDLPSSGTITFNGEELTTMSPARLAAFRNQQIGFVFQFHHLLPEFTALENVMMPALVQRLPLAVAERRAKDILGRVGLTKRLTHRPSELSGGEQQRVAVARALMNEPQLVLADEPSGNLDRLSSESLHQLLWDLSRRDRRTFIIVTHNLALAERADRVVELFDGQIRSIHVNRR